MPPHEAISLRTEPAPYLRVKEVFQAHGPFFGTSGDGKTACSRLTFPAHGKENEVKDILQLEGNLDVILMRGVQPLPF